MIYLNNDNYNSTVNGIGFYLVEFGAEWCGPCKMMEPVLEQLEQEFKGKLTVAKVDVDQNKRTADFNNIKSIPTIFIYKNGVLVEKHTGAIPKSALIEKLNKY